MSKITLHDLPQLARSLKLNPEPLESFLFACQLKNCTTATLKCYGERLAYIMRWASEQQKDLHTLTKLDLQRYVTGLIGKVSVATINGRIAAFRTFFRVLLSESFITIDPMADIRKLKQPKMVKEVLTPDDMSRVLAQFDRKTYDGCRNFTMVLLAFDAMVRVSELSSIKVDDLDLQSGMVKVFCKGRERYVAFSPMTAKALHTYLVRFRKGIQGELLFVTKWGSRISYRRVHHIFADQAKKIGLHLHPHLARHSGATQAARSGMSLAVLQQALGHSTLAVTQQYLWMNETDVKKEYVKHSPTTGMRI
ncbi:MAG: tyrosine-type recombinase/integrase [Candidatus Zixiibacteriota bacterium]